MNRPAIWKLAGLAGLAGVAATGVVVARAERRRGSYAPEDVRSHLQDHWRASMSPSTRPRRQGPGCPFGSAPLRTASGSLPFDEAVELTRTGDLWLFRGPSAADHAIRVLTNSPVNHVGMAVVIEDLPPLMWHAELGQSLVDHWTGTRHRGVQLHDLREAVTTWSVRYHQQCWLRQLDAEITPGMEDALLQEIALEDGMPFPTTMALLGRWAKGRVRRAAPAEAAYCAEVVANTYKSMGLLGDERPANWYDPGRFWSGDRLEMLGGARLGDEIEILLGEAAVE
jgi:hypothetical protein